MSDESWYRKEHILLFGHEPIPDLSLGGRCMHPIHRMIQGMMDAPGVDIEIPFNPHEVVTDDDPEVLEFERQYNDAVDSWKDVIDEIEGREEYQRRTGKK